MTDPIDPVARVLAQLVNDAGFALITDADAAVQAHCVRQYNRVLARVRALEPDIAAPFEPLDGHAGAGAVRMRARDLLMALRESRPRHWMSDLFDALFEPFRSFPETS